MQAALHKNTGRLSAWRNDCAGGIAAALVSLPFELIYGAFAVVPLGAAYAVTGIQAGLWACVLSGFLALCLRGTPGMISGTRPAAAFILAALASALLVHPTLHAEQNAPEHILVLLFLCTALAGVVQLAFGLIRMGRAVKFVPYPVISGLMTGVAILMIRAGIKSALGLDDNIPWTNIFESWHPLSAFVAGVTLCFCLRPPKKLSAIPFIITALVVGSVLHHVFTWVAGSENLGGMSPTITGLIPHYAFWEHDAFKDTSYLIGWLPTLLPYSIAIAAFASLETLLCLTIIQAKTHQHADGDKELRVQGLTNIMTGLLGGSPSIGTVSRVNTNMQSGGRSRMSGLVYAMVMAGVVLFASPAITWIPRSVTAGMLIFFGYAMIDEGTHRLLRQLFIPNKPKSKTATRMLVANLLLLTIVASVVVFGDILKATGVGVIVAMAMFVVTNMKPIVRRTLTVKSHRSLKARHPDAAAHLDSAGQSIMILELEGLLFFGTAQHLTDAIQRLDSTVKTMILDLAQVRDIDTTGAQTLLQIARTLSSRGCKLYIAGATSTLMNVLGSSGLSAIVDERYWFDDCDQALEAAEDALLEAAGFTTTNHTLALHDTHLVRGLDDAEIAILDSYLIKQNIVEKSPIFRQGDVGNSLFVAGNGTIDIWLSPDNGKMKRIASFAPGAIVGEIALLDHLPRSADACVNPSTTVWELTRSNLDLICKSHPLMGQKIFANISLSLSERLRAVNRELETNRK